MLQPSPLLLPLFAPLLLQQHWPGLPGPPEPLRLQLPVATEQLLEGRRMEPCRVRPAQRQQRQQAMAEWRTALLQR